MNMIHDVDNVDVIMAHIVIGYDYNYRRFFMPVAYPGIFFRGVQQIQLRAEGRENGDLGAVAP
jgi:hypothetical protein